MSEKLKIKVSIADRVYPLTIDSSQEENLNAASKKIDAMIKQFELNYAVRDKQDVLAMCALQFATQTLQKTPEKSTIDDSTIAKLENLNTILSKYIED